MSDIQLMNEAYDQALEAYRTGEIPVGAVLFGRGRIWGKAFNQRSLSGNPLGHAEVLAIQQTASMLGDWRLNDFTLYVTMEPCPMCSGLILQTRIQRVVYGVTSPREGCAGSVLNLLDYPGMSHHVEVCGGINSEKIFDLMQEFFQASRK